MQAYGLPLINVFLVSSTYLIVLTAIMRYWVVASPFHGRSNNFMRHSGLVSACVFACAVLMTLPQFVLHRIDVLNEELVDNYRLNTSETLYTFNPRFSQQQTNLIITYIVWIQPVLFSFAPGTCLTVFNTSLIYRLRRAREERQRVASVGRQRQTRVGGHSSSSSSSSANRLNITLVLMFSAHVILVVPSDVIKYVDALYEDDGEDRGGGDGEFAACALNLTQACNFALNFVLYISLNSSFRDVIRTAVGRLLGCGLQPSYSASGGEGRRGFVAGGALRRVLRPLSSSTPQLHLYAAGFPSAPPSRHPRPPDQLMSCSSIHAVSMCDLRALRRDGFAMTPCDL